MATTGKEEFIASMGGPTALVGTSAVTVEALACALEEVFTRLTNPGERVYRRQQNRDMAWDTLNALDD